MPIVAGGDVAVAPNGVLPKNHAPGGARAGKMVGARAVPPCGQDGAARGLRIGVVGQSPVQVE